MKKLETDSFLAAFLDEGIYYAEDSAALPDVKEAETDYKKAEAEKPEESAMEVQSVPESFKPFDFLGENKQHFTFVINTSGEAYIALKEKQVLNNVMAAIKLTFSDIALVNIQKHQIKSLAELHDKLQNKVYITFNAPANFAPGLPHSEMHEYQNAQILLLPFSITDMSADKARKVILWKNLKAYFNL